MSGEGGPTPVCNLCGTPVPRDADGHAPRKCPQCGSHERQRTFQFLFDSVLASEVFPAKKKRSHALLIAPSGSEMKTLAPRFERYTTSALFHTYKGDFVRSDIRDLAPFKDQSFDFVQACNILDFVPELDKALGAVYRVLMPGGFFCFHIIDYNLFPGSAPIEVTIRAQVKSTYYPDDYPVPRVQLGRETLMALTQAAGFKCEAYRILDPVTETTCTWWLAQRPA